jgi:hypothetical protein
MKHWPETRRLCLEGQYRVADSRSKLAVNNLAAESKIFNPTWTSSPEALLNWGSQRGASCTYACPRTSVETRVRAPPIRSAGK